jgi:hypothetical protein
MQRREVAPEIEQKILRFAQAKEQFVTKELFESYPNNPEYVLRYALNNLILDKKINMYGEKRGAFYSIKGGLQTPEGSLGGESINKGREAILHAAQACRSWFPKGGFPLSVLRELVEEGLLEWRKSGKAIEYRLVDKSREVTLVKSDLYKRIHDFIEKKKVVTIPMLQMELEVPRNSIAEIIDKLVEQELIRHEGIKKSSKYIWHETSVIEVEEIKSVEVKKPPCLIDNLSRFLSNVDNFPSITFQSDAKGHFIAKHRVLGSVVESREFNDTKGFNEYIHDMTRIGVRNG